MIPLYTFYPYTDDARGLGIESVMLRDDGEAALQTLAILKGHISAQTVVAWCDDRKVITRHRIEAGQPMPAISDD